MTEKFRNKYRIPSNRLRGWDYASNGHYYITIVTAGRERLFGDIVNGEMVLNDLGQIVYDEFFKSFELREELFLGEFVLMPNHLHAIVILDKTKCTDDVVGMPGRVETPDRVETHGRASLHEYQNIPEFCYSATREEIEQKGWSLVPSKYIEFSNRDEQIDFDTKMRELQADLRELLREEEKSKGELKKLFEKLGYKIC